MKQQDNKLTLHETEELCRLYMECKLSVLEETELQYVLTRIDYHSPLIDEVRRVMDIDAYIARNAFIKGDRHSKRFHKWLIPLSIAASIAVFFSIGLIFFQKSSTIQNTDQSYYIAYVNGYRLSGEAARLQVEAEKKSADDFIKEMSELEAQQKQMIDNFFNR